MLQQSPICGRTSRARPPPPEMVPPLARSCVDAQKKSDYRSERTRTHARIKHSENVFGVPGPRRRRRPHSATLVNINTASPLQRARTLESHLLTYERMYVLERAFYVQGISIYIPGGWMCCLLFAYAHIIVLIRASRPPAPASTHRKGVCVYVRCADVLR